MSPDGHCKGMKAGVVMSKSVLNTSIFNVLNGRSILEMNSSKHELHGDMGINQVGTLS